jgi:threonine/homoserine/homoserine lactone efflux protein
MMPPTHASLTTFVIASFVLAITPGPGVLYIVTRTLSQGRRTGLASVGGVALGNLLNALGAALGLAVLFAFSSFAFTFVKWSGAGYLIFLGVQTLLRARICTDVARVARAGSPSTFRDGVVVATLWRFDRRQGFVWCRVFTSVPIWAVSPAQSWLACR